MAGKGIRLALLCAAALAALAALAAGAAAPARAGLACTGQTYVRPFTPWLDYANYVLMPAGSLESSGGWTLAGGAKLAAGNEPWHVNSSADSRSLTLPTGSSATTPAICISPFHPDLRFFALNSGSTTATLRVEALTNVGGVQVTTPIGLLTAGGAWQPTIPLAFLDNLTSAVSGTIAFRFTPLGAGSGWRIDDLYVDPFKSR